MKKKTSSKKKKSPSNQALLLFYSWLETKLTKWVHLSPGVVIVFSPHSSSTLQDIEEWLMCLGAGLEPGEGSGCCSYRAMGGRRWWLSPVISWGRIKFMPRSVAARHTQNALYSLPTEGFLPGAQSFAPSGCSVNPTHARHNSLNVLRNQTLLCRTPLTPLEHGSQQVQAVAIYLLLEPKNSKQTAAVALETVISVSHTVNTHSEQHTEDYLESISLLSHFKSQSPGRIIQIHFFQELPRF